MRTVHFDLLCGASGDMILAAFIDAGVPVEFLRRHLSRLPIDGLTIAGEKTDSHGLGGTRLVLGWDKQKTYRHLPRILEVIDAGGYGTTVTGRCRTVLERLGKAEARAHNIPLEKVHFHEIGAVDTIIDILGASLCMEYLRLDALQFGAITIGQGTISTEHGIMPVPVPAVTNMIGGFETVTLDVATEILTPTGCAVLTGLGTQVAVRTAGSVVSAGQGCGTRKIAGYPNLLRVLVIESAAESDSDTVAVLESDMDHVDGEAMGYAMERLFEDGALDVCWIPAFMKKNRPGYRLSVLCRPQDRERLVDRIMAETRSLGVRYRMMSRTVARRSSGTVEIEGRAVRSKTCTHGTNSFTKVEHDDLAGLARSRKQPLPEVRESAARFFQP